MRVILILLASMMTLGVSSQDLNVNKSEKKEKIVKFEGSVEKLMRWALNMLPEMIGKVYGYKKWPEAQQQRYDAAMEDIVNNYIDKFVPPSKEITMETITLMGDSVDLLVDSITDSTIMIVTDDQFAEVEVKSLKSDLKLTDQQCEKIRQIVKESVAKDRVLVAKRLKDSEEYKALDNSLEEKIKAELTEKQLEKYLKIQAENRAENEKMKKDLEAIRRSIKR
ncbi:MAG: hypothetical protein J6Q35_05420 [Rikenellaceae bacterium]|nr:hypothetical protein [Rikenellaceae bacterium]